GGAKPAEKAIDKRDLSIRQFGVSVCPDGCIEQVGRDARRQNLRQSDRQVFDDLSADGIHAWPLRARFSPMSLRRRGVVRSLAIRSRLVESPLAERTLAVACAGLPTTAR